MQGRNIEKIGRKNPVVKHTDRTRRDRNQRRIEKEVNLVEETDEDEAL